MLIRDALDADWPAIWPFFHEIVVAEETYVYDPRITSGDARAMWLAGPPAHTVVAIGDDGATVMGTAKMGPNKDGPGAHIGTASFMVDPAYGGRGVGRALCEYVIGWHRAAGFRGIQFNAVVATNTNAIALYEALGFTVIGTVPGAFRSPTAGYVGLHVMYCPL